MKFTVNRTELLASAQNAERIAPRVSTIEILQCAYLQAEQDTLTVASGNLEIALEQQLPAQIESEGSVVVKAPLLSGMLRLLDGERVTFQMKNGKLSAQWPFVSANGCEEPTVTLSVNDVSP